MILSLGFLNKMGLLALLKIIWISEAKNRKCIDKIVARSIADW